MNYQVVRNEELQHHGILGMKWGKKNGPPYPLGASDHSASEKKAGWKRSLSGGSSGELSKSAQKKISKTERTFNKKISKAEESRDKILSEREKHRNKIEEKYNKKIDKAKQDRDSFAPIKDGLKDKNGRDILTKEDVAQQVKVFDDLIKEHQSKKEAKLKDFDDGTKYVKSGEQHYINVLKEYKNAKISAFENNVFKGSDEYKNAVKRYTNQVILDSMYLPAGTKLGYASDYANKASNPNWKNKYMDNIK